MPTADSFTALGTGNGFPFCLTKINVGGYDDRWHWTTLSGVNADNYTSFSGSSLQAKVDQSFAYAMKLYWTRYKVTGFSTSLALSYSYRYSQYNPEDGYSSSYNRNWSGFTDDDASTPPLVVNQPIERLCEWFRDDARMAKSNRFSVLTGWANIKAIVDSPGVKALYDGDTLLGYGLGNLNPRYGGSTQFYCGAQEEGEISAEVSIGNILYDWNSNHQDSEGHKKSFEYVTIGGMHFVEFKEGYVRVLEDPPTGDAYYGQVNNRSVILSPNSVSVSGNYAYYYNSYNGQKYWRDYSRTAYASIDPSIDFYTF